MESTMMKICKVIRYFYIVNAGPKYKCNRMFSVLPLALSDNNSEFGVERHISKNLENELLGNSNDEIAKHDEIGDETKDHRGSKLKHGSDYHHWDGPSYRNGFSKTTTTTTTTTTSTARRFPPYPPPPYYGRK